MNQPSEEPEFIVEEQEKISQQWGPSETSVLGYMDLVGDLEALSRQLTMASGTLERIQGSLRELVLSPQDTE